ncbi:MAG: TM2 domain-containing protein [Nitrospinae bacterium]|nr:TM2 domain-containing protein [Nitrospinota bacterium]
MANQSERLIALKSGLDERELHILNIELDRRRKSTGVTFALWFFLSWLGLHKFYLGRIATGVVYVVAPWILILVFANPEAGGATAGLSLLALLVYGVWWVVDLFTIPRQVNAYNESLELEIIASLNARKQRPGLSPNPTQPE